MGLLIQLEFRGRGEARYPAPLSGFSATSAPDVSKQRSDASALEKKVGNRSRVKGRKDGGL
jgi:hypothetical protein